MPCYRAMRSKTFIWLPHVCRCACCRCSRTIARASHAQHNINETHHTCCACQKHWWMLHSIALYEHCISKKKSARLARHALLGILLAKCFSTGKSENEEDPIRSYIISHCSITFPSFLQLRAGNRANPKPIPVAFVCAASLEDKTLMGELGEVAMPVKLLPGNKSSVIWVPGVHRIFILKFLRFLSPPTSRIQDPGRNPGLDSDVQFLPPASRYYRLAEKIWFVSRILLQEG